MDRTRWRWIACGPEFSDNSYVREVLSNFNCRFLGPFTSGQNGLVILLRFPRSDLTDVKNKLQEANIPTLLTSGTIRTLRNKLALESKWRDWNLLD